MLRSEVSEMYRKILYAVEDDESLAAAAAALIVFARASQAQVHVVHVDRGDPDSPTSGSSRLVDEVIERVRAADLEAAGEVLHVNRGDEVAPLITAITREAAADLVVIGSRGRSDLVGLLAGSVSHRVAAGLDAPMLILRAGARVAEPRKILVAVDGSAATDEAIDEAGVLATHFGAEVMVLHVQHVIAVQGAAIVEPESEAWAIVDRAVARLKAVGVRGWGEVHVGHHVASVIASVAEQYGADLVVLGSRRPSEVSGLLLGSVGHRVL